jgi:hypothetical protein
MICDWCGKKYPETLKNKKSFHKLEDYVYTPVICNDCYRKLKKTIKAIVD